MNYGQWEADVAPLFQGDPLWTATAYRRSLFVFVTDVAWHDVTRLVADRRTRGLSDQLYRAVGSVGANIAEGDSRSGARDRAHFYEYALGSARESRGWYFNARHLLGDEVFQHRFDLLNEVVRLLMTTIPNERRGR